MPTIGAILDACVLIPAALRDTLLRSAQRGLYRAFWSDPILVEVERNLVEHGLTSADGATRLLATLRSRLPLSLIQNAEQLVPCMTNHPKDRHVVAAAIMGRAEMIVTANISDFPRTDLDLFGIDIQTPDAFLTTLYERDPAVLVEVVLRQAAALRSPDMSVHRLLDNLGRDVPTFAGRIGDALVRDI